MNRKVGMYGGKFLPFPHMGHVYAMIEASTKVEELHIIVSHNTEHEKKLHEEFGRVEHVPYTMRLRWWTQLTKDLPHVHVHHVYEEQTGDISDWHKGAEGIKKVINKPIDTVFSSEHSYTSIFSELYPEAKHVVIDSDRKKYPISGTAIRRDGVFAHWDMIPKIVQPYFVKKVVVVGTESCGKSTLVKNLATLYNTTYVEEFGRTFYERLGGCEDITIAEDYHEIAFEHKCQEKVQLQNANKVMFIDTEAAVTQYFLNAYLNEKSKLLDELIKVQEYDLWLFLEPDVKWVNDGTRTFGDMETREIHKNQLKNLLKSHGVKFKSIKGDFENRLKQAVTEVDKIL